MENSRRQQSNKYIVQYDELIGKGTSGDIYKAVEVMSNKVVACKEMSFQRGGQSFYPEKEVLAMMKVQGTNIVKLYDYQYTRNKLQIFMEYSKNGDLAQYLSEISYSQTIDKTLLLFQQILEGYRILYEQNIIHRDLKPENCLIFGQIVKITDFGTAQILNPLHSVECSNRGTLGFQSPQLVLNCEKYTYKTDIFSLGVLLYFMIYGEQPWKSQKSSFNNDINIQKEFVTILKMGGIRKYLKFKPNQMLDHRIQDCILSMLEFNEEKRISFEELYNHEMFQLIKQLSPLQKRYSIQFSALTQRTESDDQSNDLDNEQKSHRTINRTQSESYFKESIVGDLSEMSKQFEKNKQEVEQNKKKNILSNYIKYSIQSCLWCHTNIHLIDENRLELSKAGFKLTRIDLIEYILKKLENVKYQELESQLNFYDLLPSFVNKNIGSKADFEKSSKSKDIEQMKITLEKNIQTSNKQLTQMTNLFYETHQPNHQLSTDSQSLLALLQTSENSSSRLIENFILIFEQDIKPIIQFLTYQTFQNYERIIRVLYSLTEFYQLIKVYDDYSYNINKTNQKIKKAETRELFAELKRIYKDIK